jgi:AcrR family transcriptional regulator
LIQFNGFHGVAPDDIAKILGCNPKTLRKYCRDELDRGMVEANSKVIGALFDNALAGNGVAQIFWAKSRAGWRESKEPENPIQGTNVTFTSPVVLLPDNHRDPEFTEEVRKTRERYLAKKQRQRRENPDDSSL